MKVFLVRHGLSREGAEGKGQYPESPLSDEGVRQAKAAAKRLLGEDIDLILASKWQRAKETASIIASNLGKSVEQIEGIHEKERSLILSGTSVKSTLAKKHDIEVLKNWGNLDWKFNNEGESVREVLERAAQFRDHLVKNHKNQNVLVVTHSAFIRSFVAISILGNNYSDSDIIKLWSALPSSNTGITLMEYEANNWNPWTLTYFNDHLHLEV